jgi:hypothetical protein
VASVKHPRAQRRELRWPTFAQLGALLQASQGTPVGGPDTACRGHRSTPGGGPRHLLGGRPSQDGHRLHSSGRPAGPPPRGKQCAGLPKRCAGPVHRRRQGVRRIVSTGRCRNRPAGDR